MVYEFIVSRPTRKTVRLLYQIKSSFLGLMAIVFVISLIYLLASHENESKVIDSIDSNSSNNINDKTLLKLENNTKKTSFPLDTKKSKAMISYNKKIVQTLWAQLEAINFKYPDSKELMFKLLSENAGFVIYSNIIDKINSRELNDEVVVDLVRILTDAYEGGSLDEGTYHIAKNVKDEKIQALMREQLQNPVGKETLFKVMDLLYFLEEGDNLNLLEEVINANLGMLSENEKLDYRLHYAASNSEKFSEIINSLNSSNPNKGHYNTTFFQGLSEFVGSGYNKLSDEASQTAVKTYLENNPVYEEGSTNVPNMTEYGNWLRAYAAVDGKNELDNYLYEQALRSEDPIKIIATIDNLMDEEELESDRRKVFDKLVQNEGIQETLKSSLTDPNISDVIKSEIKYSLAFYFEDKSDNDNSVEPRELEIAIHTMKEKEKAILKPQLENLLKDPSLTEDDKLKLQELLDSNF